MITELRIDGVRNLDKVLVAPAPGVNAFVGPNAAGKTSVLEAIHALSLGRSFRAGGRYAWLNRAAGEASIFAATRDHKLGLLQRRSEWHGRIDGEDARDRARFSSLLPVFVFHPDAHSLVEGEPLHRRRLVDQGVFHVEQSFLDAWRRYRRALAQRNAGLRTGVADRVLTPWEQTMVEAGEAITGFRQRYVEELNARFRSLASELQARIPELSLQIHVGWPAEESLAEALERTRRSDRERMYTQVGPQRADLRIRDDHGVVSGRLSRGQQKLVALMLVVAQASLFETSRAESPLFLLDDVGSELDREHEVQVGQWLVSRAWQVWLTGLSMPDWLAESSEARVFHVEQGRIRRADEAGNPSSFT